VIDLLEQPPVVFDARAVASLTGDAADHEVALVFVTRFRRMLPERVRRIVAALGSADATEAMDAVLSLKAASGTLGAGELFELGTRMEARLRQLDLADAAVLAEELPAAAKRAYAALTTYLEDPEGR